jgi:hypothetical protein
MSWLEKTVNGAERTTRAMQSGARRVRRGYREVRRIYNMPGSGIRGYIAAGKRHRRP